MRTIYAGDGRAYYRPMRTSPSVTLGGVSEDRGVEADGVEEELTFDPETIGGECGEVVDGVLQEARPLLAGLGAFLAFEAGDPGSVHGEAEAELLGGCAD